MMINNIYCVGRNFAEHAKELGNQIESVPVIFSKPNTSLVEGDTIILPDFSHDIHYETEMVLKISQDGFKISENKAENYYDEIALGLDLTARDLQTALKEKKLPWFLAKGFKDSCYLSSFVKKELLSLPICFSMKLNGEERQRENSNNMIFNFSKIISYISQFVPLKKSDVIFTGTPKGVGKLKSGDQISLFLQENEIAIVKVK